MVGGIPLGTPLPRPMRSSSRFFGPVDSRLAEPTGPRADERALGGRDDVCGARIRFVSRGASRVSVAAARVVTLSDGAGASVNVGALVRIVTADRMASVRPVAPAVPPLSRQ